MEAGHSAFVIWVDAPEAADGTDGVLAGRVEHLQSSARATFHSAAELLAFLDACRRGAASDG